jgi:DNA-binding LytR/AlgR family response regulator
MSAAPSQPGGAARGPTALIADDEPLLRAQLAEALGTLWPDLRIVAEAAHGAEAVERIAELRPDIAFLDIEMPGLNGLEAAAQIKAMAHIVFVTAYDRYAVEAFERGAIDYVLKPASEGRLAETVARLRARVAQPPPDAARLHEALEHVARALGKPPARLRWIQASVGPQVRLVRTDDILFFRSDLKYTRVVTAKGEALIRRTLRELMLELDPETFWQIHRGTVVNAQAIAHALRDEDGRVTLTLNGHAEKLEVSRTYAHLFRAM